MVWRRAQAHVETFFAGIQVREVTATTAKEFRNWLFDQPGRKPGSKMATATVNKTCGIVSQAFGHGVEIGLIPSNPFNSRSIPKSAGANPAREAYVRRDTVLEVISRCANAEDRMVIALARFGCLRMPSEARELRWADIDWDRREMRVNSPKTAHHGKAARTIPLFDDLFALLRKECQRGCQSEYVLPTLRKHPSLAMRVKRAAKTAGVPMWEKALQNLRASGVTDWAGGKHDVQVVAAWTGHSVTVMHKHYLRIKDADSASRAALMSAGSGDASGDGTPIPVVSQVVKSPLLNSSKETSPATEAAGDDGLMEFPDESGELVTVGGDHTDDHLMDLIGLEPTTSSMPWKRSSN